MNTPYYLAQYGTDKDGMDMQMSVDGGPMMDMSRMTFKQQLVHHSLHIILFGGAILASVYILLKKDTPPQK